MKADLRNKVLQERRKLTEHLQKRGRKLSSARAKVFETIINTHGHFAAEDLVKICRGKRTRVSRASIYRCLRELLEAGVIRETAFGKKHQLFEHVYDEKPHHHARCIRCHAVIEIPDYDEEKVYQPLLEKQGFEILGHEMHFYGICRSCRAG